VVKVIDKRVKRVVQNTDGIKYPSIKNSVPFETYIRMVELKAYELYLKRGARHGHDREDWVEAKKLVEEELRRGTVEFYI
jgi:Protein of unknown function (DUF2934)